MSMLIPQAESVSTPTHPAALESSQSSTHASAQSSIPTVKVSFQTMVSTMDMRSKVRMVTVVHKNKKILLQGIVEYKS